MTDILETLAIIVLVAIFVESVCFIYMVVRKKKPFHYHVEPRHSWEMTRAEREAQEAAWEQAEADRDRHGPA